MKYMLYSSLFLLSLSVSATDYVSPTAVGEYDDQLECIVDIDGLCESVYVEDLFEICKDCDIETPEKAKISSFEAWYRSLGIKLAYKYYEEPLELAGYIVATLLGSYAVFKVLRR